MRKVITFDQTNYTGAPVTWIEGIGALTGLYPFGFTIDISFYLVCHTNNGLTTMFNDFDECAFLNTEEYFKENINITPNQISELATLTIPQEIQSANITVFDVNGKQLMKQDISEMNTTINFSSLTSGMYFYNIYAENILILTKKSLVK